MASPSILTPLLETLFSWYSVPPLCLLALIGYLTWHFWRYGNNGAGPTIYPFIGSLPDILSHYPFLYDRAAQILEGCPSMTYVSVIPGVKEVITAHPDNIQHILKTNFANYPKGPQFQENFRQLLGHGIFNSDGEVWRSQRKSASLEFSTNSLRLLMLHSIHQEVELRLLPTLRQAMETGAVVDMQDVLLRYTFDNICRIGFGVDPGCLAPHLPLIPFAHSFDLATKITMRRNIMPEWTWKLLRFFRVGMEGEMERALQEMDEFTGRVIRKRREEMGLTTVDKDTRSAAVHPSPSPSPSPPLSQTPTLDIDAGKIQEHSDILSRMIALDAADKGRLYSDRFLRDACANFILAGRDTSSVALSWLFWLLSWHPEEEQKILEEVNGIVERRGAGRESDPFSFDELKSMVYTHAAINESLRLYPSVPADSKYVAADDVLPDGTRVRKGWRVMYAIYAVGRMTRVWGEDADQFKPGRWISDQGTVKLESPFKFPAFNAGPRLCLGKDMAYMQMKSVVASVLRNFKLKVDPTCRVEYALSLTLCMKNGLLVRVLPRSQT